MGVRRVRIEILMREERDERRGMPDRGREARILGVTRGRGGDRCEESAGVVKGSGGERGRAGHASDATRGRFLRGHGLCTTAYRP